MEEAEDVIVKLKITRPLVKIPQALNE